MIIHYVLPGMRVLCLFELRVMIIFFFFSFLSLQPFSHKGHGDIVHYLLAHGADVHVKRDLNPLATRGNHRLSRVNLTYGDSLLSVAVKYGFEEIAIEVVEHGSEILDDNHEFEKSSSQDAVRLNRARTLEVFIRKSKATRVNSSGETKALYLRRKAIFFIDVYSMIKSMHYVFLYRIFGKNRAVILCLVYRISNNLRLKNEIQSDKAFDVLETILEAIPTAKLKMYDIGDFLKRFLHILQAQFVTINDDRIQILYLRTSLLLSILKDHETVDFYNYLDLLDAYFRAIYNSVENAGRIDGKEETLKGYE